MPESPGLAPNRARHGYRVTTCRELVLSAKKAIKRNPIFPDASVKRVA
jgi:hypothetical protein